MGLIHRKLAFVVYKMPKICFSCGSNKNIHVHHIDGNRKNNSKGNLQVLCAGCHSHIHYNKENRLGIPCSDAKKRKIAKANSNRIWKKESKEKLSNSLKGKQAGEKHWNWQGGIGVNFKRKQRLTITDERMT